MQTKRGRIEKQHSDISARSPGREDISEVEEQPVHATDDELIVIDAGLAEAREPERIDARAFLRELRLGR